VGPNREQHLAAGVLVLMFDSEKGKVLFLNAFEYHFFVKCFKYLMMRRCRLCYLVLKLTRKMLCVDCGSSVRSSCQSSSLLLVADFEKGRCLLQVARPKGKSLQAAPLLVSTDEGHGAHLLAASSWSWTGTLFLKSSGGCVSCAD